MLTVGWFGFNVMSAQTLERISGLVAVNSLLAMVGGTLAAGIFGSKALGGLGGVALGAQLIGTFLGLTWVGIGGLLIYSLLKATMGLRLSQEEEYDGADLSIHKISASPEREANW